jgi:AhpD family alkylhydroperoxidase
MLGVTSVNDCRYCNWGHTALALRNGVDLAALRQTLGSRSLSTDSTPDEVAIWYAQHVAREHGDADPEAERALAAAWTPDEQAEIRAYITAITFGNLTGNSADAWLARLHGVPVEGGHPAGRRSRPWPPAGALVSVGVEPRTGIRGDRLAISSCCAWFQPARAARCGRLFP